MASSGSQAWSAKLLRLFPRLVAAGVIATGIAVLAGWALGVPALKSVLPGTVTMKANTAISFILLGAALLLRLDGVPLVPAARGRMAATILGVVVALMGSLVLVEYAGGVDLGIDQAVFRDDPNPASTSSPGRMSPATALAFLLSGVGVAVLDFRAGRDLWPAQFLFLSAGFVGFLAFNGYLLDVTELYRVYAFTSIAAHTSVCFMLLSSGFLLERPDRGFVAIATGPRAGSALLRRLLPVAVLAPIGIGWARLQGQRSGLYGTEFGLYLMIASLTLILGAVLVGSARSLNVTDDGRTRAEAGIRQLNAELEERVRQRTAELEAANKELEAFSYSVSHDLRAPLRAVDGFARILVAEHAVALDAEARRYLSLVMSNAAQMGALVDDLLEFSRLGKQELRRQRVDVKQVAAQALAELEHMRAGRAVEVRIGDLPPATADPRLLKQVFANLLSNALKYTRKREKAGIEVGSRPEKGATAYFVKDNGAGFDMRYVSKLFGVFQRLHRQEEYEGTGVGLAIVQRIVRRHGGAAWAEAEVDKGATFYFTLEGVAQDG